MEPCHGKHVLDGLLLVGHGTRDEQGRAEFLRTAELVAERAPALLVQPCFLELADPTIATGIQQLAQRGATRLTVAPLLLFSAGHAKRDIPNAVRQAIEGTQFGEFVCAGHLGCHPRLQQLSQRRCQQVLEGQPHVESEQSLLLLVGRGSHDREATAEMHRFAELRGTLSDFHLTQAAFLAMARPSLDETLAEIPSLRLRRIVVQPHLLFQGGLLTSLRHRIERIACRQNGLQWLVTQHLGPSKLLAEVVLARYLQAQPGQGF